MYFIYRRYAGAVGTGAGDPMKAILLAWAALVVSVVNAQFAVLDLYKPAIFTNEVGDLLPYRIMYTPGETPDVKVPLIISLHGSGECGTNNLNQLRMGIGALHAVYLTKYQPLMVIAPQCSARGTWVRKLAFKPDYKMPRYPASSLKSVKALADSMVAAGKVDPERIYIMGVSLGGFGVWDAIERWPNYFAAAVPVCGGGAMQEDALKNAMTTSIHVFHGELDASVPVDCARRLVKALTEREASVIYTEYPKAGHGIWDRVYGDKALFDWLLERRRGELFVPEKEPEPSWWRDVGLEIKKHFTPN